MDDNEEICLMRSSITMDDLNKKKVVYTFVGNRLPHLGVVPPLFVFKLVVILKFKKL